MRYELFWKNKILTRERMRSEAHTVWEFGEQETVDIDDIGDYVDLDEYRYIEGDALKRFKLDPPFVAELRDVTILDGTGDAVTRDGEFVMDVKARAVSSTLDVVKEWARDAVEIPSSDEFDFEVAVSFCGAVRPDGFVNYWGWVHHYLTRLEGVATYRAETGVDPVIILPEGAPRFARESLEFFGFGDLVVEWEPAQRLRVERLIVPSNRFPERMGAEYMLKRVVSPSAARWLRDEANRRLSPYETDTYDKLLISRQDAGVREIENHQEINSLLASLGSNTVVLSELPFEQQVFHFMRAEIVIGLSGAGMVNMIFNKGGLFVIIFGDVLVPSYYYLSACLNNKIKFLKGNSVENQRLSVINRNVVVDEDDLKNILS